MAAWLLVLVAQGPVVPPSWLAPSRDQVLGLLAEAVARHREARAVEVALARTHNAIAAALALTPQLPCEHPQIGRFAATERFFRALTDQAQSARAAQRRVEQLHTAPTVAPLLGNLEQQRLEQIKLEVQKLELRYLELHGWQQRHVVPVLERCKPSLVPLPGLEGPPRATNDPRWGIAVTGAGAGRLCPADAPAVAVVVTDGQACYGIEGCGCTSFSVAPGAVLGP